MINTKNAIVLLTKGYNNLSMYNRLIARNNLIYEKIISKIDTEYIKNIDIIIFHEGNINDSDKEYIQNGTPKIILNFINIKETFPKTAFDDKKNIINYELCPPTKLSNSFSLGYKHMCHFWSIDFLEYLKDYKYIMRIDEDCLLDKFDINIFNIMQEKNLVYISPFFQKQDNSDVIIGLDKLLNNFINLNNIIPYKNFSDINCPYTNLMIIDIEYFNNHIITKKFLEYVEFSNGIYSNRWGDLPIWGVILSIFIDPNLYSNYIDISYIHDVHRINM